MNSQFTISLRDALANMPVIPALRGITRAEAPKIADLLFNLGFRVFEVPVRTINPAFSPLEKNALEVLEFLVDEYRGRAQITAGTVTQLDDLPILSKLGITTCFSLNFEDAIVRDAVERNMNFIPGVETITEAIAASKAGAAGLKLFPAVIRELDQTSSVRLTPGFVNYLSKFFSVPIIPSGNSFDNGIALSYIRAGASAVNVGAQLYQAGIELKDLERRLIDFTAQFSVESEKE